MIPAMTWAKDVVVVGGCGHVGLPLGVAFAQRGLSVVLYDLDAAAVDLVGSGRAPFMEPGLDEALEKQLAAGAIEVSLDTKTISSAEHIVVVVGTPIDRHLNPELDAVLRVVREIFDHLRDGQLLVLRSTVYPGVTSMVNATLQASGKRLDVAFCPERVAEGRALTELQELPQIVSGCSQQAVDRARTLFGNLTETVLQLSPEEAELAKLFTNTWRYFRFAAANQLYTVANDFGLDFERIRGAIVHEYPRAADMPRAGFAAGPCLFKDTAQLAAFNNNNFLLGQASMSINEGLPLYLVSRLEQRFDLKQMKVGILGMAFKAESDDPRSSLSYKLKQILQFKAANVSCTDPYVKDEDLKHLEEVLASSDLLIIGAPHELYREVRFEGPIADIWGILGGGVRV